MKIIMLVNDDGIHSKGLLALKKALEDLGKIIVVAPLHEVSGIGKAITCGKTIKVKEVKLADGTKAYGVEGTPADSFLIGVNKILKRKPDLLVSGINLGPNLGVDDLLNSGTLGAALEAAIHRVPAIAISYCMDVSEDASEKNGVPISKLELSAKIARKTAEYVLNKGMPEGVDIISINVPARSCNLSDVKITVPSYKHYGDIHIEVNCSEYCIPSWPLDLYPDDAPGTDIYAVKVKGCISITPIKVKFEHKIDALKELLNYIRGGNS